MKYVVVMLIALTVVLVPVLGRIAQAQQQLGQGDTFYDIIKNDHKLITEDFKKVSDATDNEQKKAAFNSLKRDLFAHMRAEETHWYPVLQNDQQTNGLAIQAKDEHLSARTELEKISANWKTEAPRLDLAEKLVNDHVKFEESTMFDASKKAIGADEEKKITQQFKETDKS
jgi:hemerythrin superfamily protein